MKQVTVYTTKKNVVPSYGDTIPIHNYIGMSEISFQSGEYFPKAAIETIHLPIRKFRRYDMQEFFAAFDEELLELIGCLQEQRDDEIMRAKIKIAEASVKSCEADLIKRVKSMSFWQKVKFVITGEVNV